MAETARSKGGSVGRRCVLMLPPSLGGRARHSVRAVSARNESDCGRLRRVGGALGVTRPAHAPPLVRQPPHPCPLPLGGGEGDTQAACWSCPAHTITEALPMIPPLPFRRGEGRGEGSVLPLRFMAPIRAESSVEPFPEWAKPVAVIVATIIPPNSLARRKHPQSASSGRLRAPIEEQSRNNRGIIESIPPAPGL